MKVNEKYMYFGFIDCYNDLQIGDEHYEYQRENYWKRKNDDTYLKKWVKPHRATLLEFYRGQAKAPIVDELDAGCIIVLVDNNGDFVFYDLTKEVTLQLVKDPHLVQSYIEAIQEKETSIFARFIVD